MTTHISAVHQRDPVARRHRLFRPEHFKEKFVEWVKSVATVSSGESVAIDGKTLRRSHYKAANKQAIHVVRAWASNAHLVLGQRKVDEKSNEITAMSSPSGCPAFGMS